MAEKEVGRIFVGGLSWDTTERTLERAFSEYGKVIETQVVLERDTGRSRGFGFVTFSEPRAVDAAIRGMHNGELDGRTISVNKAQPRMNTDDGYGYGGGGGGGEVDIVVEVMQFPLQMMTASNVAVRDIGLVNVLIPVEVGVVELEGDRYGGSDRYASSGFTRERSYERDGGRSGGSYYRDEPRGSGGYDRGGMRMGSGDRYGTGGPARFAGSYRDRPAPYDRPSRAAARTYDDRY
uniref:RRM domain-containing protein n=1 Tax=Oryza nivara TaxID=4536 RepID=A0A0E0HXL8_ORYNI